MFSFQDPGFQLDLYRQRAGERQREAAAERLAREATGAGRPRWSRWSRWARPGRRPQPVCAPAAC